MRTEDRGLTESLSLGTLETFGGGRERERERESLGRLVFRVADMMILVNIGTESNTVTVTAMSNQPLPERIACPKDDERLIPQRELIQSW